MQKRSLKSRFRRLFRLRKRQVEDIGSRAEQQLERNFLRKFPRLRPVGRFVAVWVALVIVLAGCVVVQTRALSGYYKTLQPAPGGIYSEGMVDSYTNANPLYATGSANRAVSKLLFAGLFKYDERNHLVGDLARSWQADPSGKRYTVRLKPELRWHDGRPLTAEDVVFTYRTIQNPDVQSPLNVSWQNVQVTASGQDTVIFDLPNPLSSFPHSLTNGIIPQHALKDIPPKNLRSSQFNTIKPVGAGPYRLERIEVDGNTPATRQEEIALVPFRDYHAGAPKIARFIIRTFPSSEMMFESFRDQTINAMVDPEGLPDDIAKAANTQSLTMPLTAANMVFFKTSSGPLQEAPVRQALVAASDIGQVTTDLPKPVLPVRSPFLQSSPSFDPQFQQTYLGADKAAAMLEAAGWKLRPDGLRAKDGQVLMFKLFAQQQPEYDNIAKRLREQWRAIGVDAQVELEGQADLPSTVARHEYDALLYGISLGVDPDVYVYWHSKQADVRSLSRLNLSEYRSAVADASLEEGRTRLDPTLRNVKYQAFLRAWQQDAPALGLYQPHFTYVTRGQVSGLTERTLTDNTDRFNTVEKWMVRKIPQQIR